MSALPLFYRATDLFIAYDNSVESGSRRVTAHPIALKSNGVLTRFESAATWFDRFFPNANP